MRDGKEEEIFKLVKPLRKYDRVLMIYFPPRKSESSTPTPGVYDRAS
jgi:hypothetical protein